MRKKGFTLIELLVVISIIAMLLAILMPALNKVKKIAMRVVCATNLKGMGTAQMVYANDYDDDYVVQGGRGQHDLSSGTDNWGNNNGTKDWNTTGNITVGASLFLLVREADVSPKSFICPSSDEQEFSGTNPLSLDLVELWDFGHLNYPDSSEGPTKCVSYSYHMPYAGSPGTSTGSRGVYAANGTQSASFAMMADKNPFFDDKLENGSSDESNFLQRVALIGGPSASGAGNGFDWEGIEKWTVQHANAQSHGREGQNVLFGDGHASHEKRSDIGIRNDNIYTRWVGTGTTEADLRRGEFSTDQLSFYPIGSDDSVLVNDAEATALP